MCVWGGKVAELAEVAEVLVGHYGVGGTGVGQGWLGGHHGVGGAGVAGWASQCGRGRGGWSGITVWEGQGRLVGHHIV